jgi:hypothetical protein
VGALAPARGLVSRRLAFGEKYVVAGADFFVIVKSADQGLAFSQLARPKRRPAYALRWNRLQIGQRFGVTLRNDRRYRRKSLVIRLYIAIKTQCERAERS